MDVISLNRWRLRYAPQSWKPVHQCPRSYFHVITAPTVFAQAIELEAAVVRVSPSKVLQKITPKLTIAYYLSQHWQLECRLDLAVSVAPVPFLRYYHIPTWLSRPSDRHQSLFAEDESLVDSTEKFVIETDKDMGLRVTHN